MFQDQAEVKNIELITKITMGNNDIIYSDSCRIK